MVTKPLKVQKQIPRLTIEDANLVPADNRGANMPRDKKADWQRRIKAIVERPEYREQTTHY